MTTYLAGFYSGLATLAFGSAGRAWRDGLDVACLQSTVLGLVFVLVAVVVWLGPAAVRAWRTP